MPMRRRDMATLQPLQWLNDEVVNLFFKILEHRASSDVGLPPCCFMNSLFYPKLAESAVGKSPVGYKYVNVERWTRGMHVFSMAMVLVPIHCHGNHWTLAVINLPKRRFEYYDSLRGSPGLVLFLPATVAARRVDAQARTVSRSV